MQFQMDSSPHLIANHDVSRMMRQLLYALVPGTAAMIWFYGWGVVFNLVFAIVFALVLETLALYVRKRPIVPFLSDYSALVTAWLLAIALPPLSAWWMIFIGIFFAIIVAKHLYGGLGYNLFNPAMVGFAVLIVSFPREMSLWLAPVEQLPTDLNFMSALQISLGGLSTSQFDWDAMTMATPLDYVKTQLDMGTSYRVIQNESGYGLLSSPAWMWGSLLFGLGGIWLIYQGIITWRIPVALLSSLAVISTVFYMIDSQAYASPLFHLLSGAAILGAFFIATDPVSASTTPTGQLIYASCIGLFIYIIRTWGGYPDAIAFAVLLMNTAVPLVDYYTQPRILGGRNKHSKEHL